MEFKQGVQLSPKDERDYPITMLVPKLSLFPRKFEVNIPPELKAYNQGIYSMCVAFSLTYIKEIQEYKERGKFTRLSPSFIYSNRKPSDYLESGAIPSQLLANLKNNGVCEYNYFPELAETPDIYNLFKQKVTPAILENAKKYKIKAYARLDENNRNEIKSALMQIGAVTATIEVYENYYTETTSEGILPNPKGTFVYPHQVTIIGYDDDRKAWKVLNSWGTDWGCNGYFWFPYDSVYEEGKYLILEAWSVTDSIEANPIQKFHLVLIGKFKTKQLAINYMKVNKLKGIVVQKGNVFSIQMGSFKNKVDADKLVVDIKKKKHFVYVLFE